jgi:tRNA 2-selenouridine synthase
VVLKKNMGLHPAGWSPLGPQQFLERSLTVPVIDVRAPKEFRQGHIPGAFSLPLFDNNERAAVGITYTRTGREEALMKGLEITGPKLKDFVKQGREIASDGELLVHCWRGGMRSEAMAWLFNYSGIRTSVLTGGYKAYRHYIRKALSQGPPLAVLGGMTGSGKTEILKFLSSIGEQVLDLEGHAHHKGSAFGSLGQEDQPTNEQFENNLACDWLAFDHNKPVWTEDESRNIGKVIIPEPLFLKMAAAPMVFVDIPFDYRVKRLAEEYGSFELSELSAYIRKISPRMGGDKANAAISALEKGNLTGAVSEVLAYYDKAYQYGLSRYEGREILNIKRKDEDLQSISKQVIKLIQNSKYKI